MSSLPTTSFAQWLRRLGVACLFATQSLWSARRRMWLVVLSSAIGFGAIDSMLIIGSSMQAQLKASLDSLGGDVLSLQLDSGQSLSSLRALDNPSATELDKHPDEIDLGSVIRLIRALPQVESAVWTWQETNCQMDSEDVIEVGRYLSSVDIQRLLSFKLAAGRLLHPGDVGQHNLILGATAFKTLQSQLPGVAVGSLIQQCGHKFRIVGVLQPHPGSDLVSAFQINHSALVASKKTDNDALEQGQSMLIRLRPGTPPEAYSRQLIAYLKTLMPGRRAQANGAWEFMKLREEQVALYARFLAILGGVSLLVGALGIANMMLVSVTERRSEIGLRLAIGAKRADIVLQFISEGVLICAIGAVVGFLVGWLVSSIALQAGGVAAIISPTMLAVAGATALLSGVVSGAYPAYRAASVDPVASLQG